MRFYTEADAAKQLRVMQASGKYGKVADARADLVPLAQVRARHSHQNRPVTAGVCLSAHGRARKAVSHLDTGRRSHVRIAHDRLVESTGGLYRWCTGSWGLAKSATRSAGMYQSSMTVARYD